MLAWSTLVLSQSPLRVEIVGTLAVRVLFFVIPSTLFLAFDSILPSLSVGIKTQGAPALPTRTGGVSGARRGRGRPEWYQLVAISILNVCFSIAIQAGVELLFTEVLDIRSALKVTTTLPMPWSIARDVVRSLLLREVFQYYIHRFILHARSPNFFSKVHNSWYHANVSPYSFCTNYDHPVAHLLWRFIPSYLPSALFRVHMLTFFFIISLTSLEETLSLSGYSTIPGILLGGVTRRQDLHSEGRGEGNFAPWGFMDWLHGTSIGPDLIDDVRDEAEKHQVAERSGRALDNAKESGKAGIRAWHGRKRSAKQAS